MGKVIFLALIVYFVLRSFWDLRESGESESGTRPWKFHSKETGNWTNISARTG